MEDLQVRLLVNVSRLLVGGDAPRRKYMEEGPSSQLRSAVIVLVETLKGASIENRRIELEEHPRKGNVITVWNWNGQSPTHAIEICIVAGQGVLWVMEADRTELPRTVSLDQVPYSILLDVKRAFDSLSEEFKPQRKYPTRMATARLKAAK